MSIFDQIGEKITSTSQETMAKAKNFTETTKLNSRISDLERQISMTFTEIGRAYYESHKDDPQAELADRLKGVSQLYAEIKQCKEQIQKIKGAATCPSCGAVLTSGAAFCNTCGQKIPSAAPAEASQAPRTCPNCQKPVSADAAFCTSCGHPLNS